MVFVVVDQTRFLMMRRVIYEQTQGCLRTITCNNNNVEFMNVDILHLKDESDMFGCNLASA